MDRVTGNTVDLGSGRRGFRDRNLGLSQAGTIPGASWFNGAQEEIVRFVELMGLGPTDANREQLIQAARRMAGGYVRTIAANTVLTADDAGVVRVNAAGGPISVTLPAANAAGGAPLRITLLRTDTSANAVTVQRAGADLIEGSASTLMGLGARLTLVSDGASAWFFGAEGSVIRSLVANGFVTLPGGLIVQWGTQGSAGLTNTNLVFPIAFPNACMWVGGTGLQAGGGVQAYTVLNSFNTGGAVFNCFFAAAGNAPVLANANQVFIYFLAIGR